MERLPLAVFSHLRWRSVFQRPQQLLSRISETRPVLYFEEPVETPSRGDTCEVQFPLPNLTVFRPLIGRGGAFDPERLEPVMRRWLRWQGAERHVAWLYTPLAFPLASALAPERIVYDCMDELSAFLGADPTLRRLEAELLQAADLVFAGGPSLYRAKRALSQCVHCFPSSVDAQHFRPSPTPLPEPPDQRALPRPRLGFFGVIDERMDLALLDRLAASRPDWQFVLVGPVLKIDATHLPRRANLHYLGQRPYAELPRYAAGWDVCLMPFARNRSTRFISPTKTLEYMAAEKPIVSTPIQDVMDPYGDLIEVAADAASFAAACERVLAETPAARRQRLRRTRRLLAKTSWDATVQAMLAELDALAQRGDAPALEAEAVAAEPELERPLALS